MNRRMKVVTVLGACILGLFAAASVADEISQILSIQPFVVMMFGAASSLMFAIAQAIEPEAPETLDDRIKRLTTTLRENVKVISEIENEVKTRRDTLARS